MIAWSAVLLTELCNTTVPQTWVAKHLQKHSRLLALAVSSDLPPRKRLQAMRVGVRAVGWSPGAGLRGLVLVATSGLFGVLARNVRSRPGLRRERRLQDARDHLAAFRQWRSWLCGHASIRKHRYSSNSGRTAPTEALPKVLLANTSLGRIVACGATTSGD